MEKTFDFNNYPWANAVENAVKYMIENRCNRVVVVGANDNGEAVTACSDNMGPYEKLYMAGFVLGDAIIDIVMANADMIVNKAKEIEEEDGEEEDQQ